MLESEKLIDSRDPLIPFHRSSKHKLSHRFSLFPHTNCMKTSNLAVCKDPIAIHRCIHSQCVNIPFVYNCFVLPWQLIIANVYPHALCLAGLQCFPFSFLSIAETVSIGSKPSVGVVSPYNAQVRAIQEKFGKAYSRCDGFSLKVKSVSGEAIFKLGGASAPPKIFKISDYKQIFTM